MTRASRGVAGICTSLYSATTAIGAVQRPILKSVRSYAISLKDRAPSCDWVPIPDSFHDKKATYMYAEGSLAGVWARSTCCDLGVSAGRDELR